MPTTLAEDTKEHLFQDEPAGDDGRTDARR